MTPEATLLGIVPRLCALLRSRGGLITLLAFVLTAVVCAFVPLADHLGFEFAMALTIVGAFFAPAAGTAAIRLEKERSESERSFGSAAVAAGVLGLVGIVTATGLILLNGVRRPTCEPLGGAAWAAVLPIPTVLLAAAVGALARARAKTTRGVVGRVLLIEVVPLLVGLASIYWGPAFFLFDHFFGYFPGPLYDETVVLSSTVLIFRAITVGWAFVALIAVSAFSNRVRWSRLLTSATLAMALLLVSAVWGTRIGYWSTDVSVAKALGGERVVDNLELHFPREWSEKTVDQFVRDAAFRASQVEEALGIKPKHRVRVWMYRSTEEKRKLVGAASTSFAKPWRHEIHIHSSGFPHPVIRHELVHAFAGEIAEGAFGVPGGLFPVTPLIEGFAVALDQENDGMTLEQWAKSMRAAKLSPDIPALLSPTGFYAAAPSRAYTYAGAFIRFLQKEFGREKVLELYRTGELSRLGEPNALVAKFEQQLDALTVGDSEKATAERRFSRPSVFHRQCAREVSSIVDEAHALMAQGKQSDSIAKFEQACSMEPDDPALLRNLLTAAIRSKNVARRDEFAAKLLAHPKLDPLLRASVLVELGDDAWRGGNLDDARQRYSEAAALPVDPQSHRNAVARVEALATPERAELLKPLLVDGTADVGQLFKMRDYLNTHPEDGFIEYLLGRQLVQKDARDRGIPLLESSLQHSPPNFDFEFTLETLRLLGRAYAEQQECGEAAKVTERLRASKASVADLQAVDDWIARCQFEVTRVSSGL